MSAVAERIGFITLIRVIIESWNELFLIILIAAMQVSKNTNASDEHKKKIKIPLTHELLIFFSASFVYSLCNIITALLYDVNSPVLHLVVTVSVFMYYVTGSFQTLFFLQVIKIHIAHKLSNDKLKKAITAFQLLQIPLYILLLITPFTNAIYKLSDNNLYQRSWGFYIWQGATIITFVFIGVIIISKWKNIDSFLKKIIVTASVFPMLGFVGSLFLSEFSLNSFTVVITAFIMFLLYEKNKTEVIIRYEKAFEKAKTELAEAQLTLMQAQIRPHFINNAMLAIQELCYTEPQRAAEVLDHFARYLRNNINATNSTYPIPFAEEVQAVNEYLAVEYADTSKVFQFEFDLKSKEFKVPALSVEPLIENAVKHGIDRYSSTGKVILSSFETDEAYHIMIKDNGNGFDMNDETLGKGGIGLKNTEQRLKLMCSGRLEIKHDNGWTIAEITIPKVQEDNNDNGNL